MRVTEKIVHDFATLIYLAIEVECEFCHERFIETDGSIGDREADVWRWAQKNAEAACKSGWRPVEERVLCPECLSKSHVSAA
jgi:hypothetical protein